MAALSEDDKNLLELQNRLLESSQTLSRVGGWRGWTNARVHKCSLWRALCLCAHAHASTRRPLPKTVLPPPHPPPQLAMQERNRMMQLKRNDLMVTELKVMPDDVKTYRGVGKA